MPSFKVRPTIEQPKQPPVNLTFTMPSSVTSTKETAPPWDARDGLTVASINFFNLSNNVASSGKSCLVRFGAWNVNKSSPFSPLDKSMNESSRYSETELSITISKPFIWKCSSFEVMYSFGQYKIPH